MSKHDDYSLEESLAIVALLGKMDEECEIAIRRTKPHSEHAGFISLTFTDLNNGNVFEEKLYWVPDVEAMISGNTRKKGRKR